MIDLKDYLPEGIKPEQITTDRSLRWDRVYWACPDVERIAQALRENDDPVAARRKSEEIAGESFRYAMETAVLAAMASKNTIIRIYIGERRSDQVSWSDLRSWYPVVVELSGDYVNPGDYHTKPYRESPLMKYGYAHAADPTDLLARGFKWLETPGIQFDDMDHGGGWHLYEYRLQTEHCRQERKPWPIPMWDGGKIPDGKRLLIHTEQGAGDIFQFFRYVPWHLPITLVCPDQFLDLFRDSAAPGKEGCIVNAIHPRLIPEFHAHVPMGSLLLAAKGSTEPVGQYLRAKGRREIFDGIITSRTPGRRRVGVCWAGGETHKANLNRTLRLDQILQYVPDGADIFSLQKGPTREQLKFSMGRAAIVDITDSLKNWRDTAFLIEMLDEVVTCDTALAHLAGALGKPVKLILGPKPEWRWQCSRWYNSLDLVRPSSLA